MLWPMIVADRSLLLTRERRHHHGLRSWPPWTSPNACLPIKPMRPTVCETGSSAEDQGSHPVHRLKTNALSPRPKAYRRRNVIERMFCRLKNWRRIATRYDRHAQNYLSGLALAAIMCQWI